MTADVFPDPTPGTTYCATCHRPMMSHRWLGASLLCPEHPLWEAELPRWEPEDAMSENPMMARDREYVLGMMGERAPRSRLTIIPDGGFVITTPAARPNWWWRWWQWVLLGWTWENL